MALADRAARDGNPASVTDGAVGVQLGFAAVRGALWNAEINLADIADADYVAGVRDECGVLLAEARALADANAEFVESRLR